MANIEETESVNLPTRRRLVWNNDNEDPVEIIESADVPAEIVGKRRKKSSATQGPKIHYKRKLRECPICHKMVSFRTHFH